MCVSLLPASDADILEAHRFLFCESPLSAHLSVSSLSLYRNSAALWVLRYLYGIKDEANSYAWRGSAIEAAVDGIVLDDISDEAAIERAIHAFELNAQGESAPDLR